MFPRLICLILTLTSSTASSAGQSVVKLEGDSVTLNTQRPAETGITLLIWSFNMETDIVIYFIRDDILEIKDNYKDKVLFNKATFSLLVKNLQKNDSGIYTAEGSGSQVLAKYSLSVLEPVEAPVLTLVTYWSTSDSCNVTVSCTGGDRSLMSSCDSSFCTPEGGASTDSTLSLSVRDDIIVCNHSNPVSWKKQTIEMNLCYPENRDAVGSSAGFSPCLLKAALISVLLLIMASAVIVVHIREKQRKSD
ncbi:T-lymphocyte surface antigen Ly-9-like [Denticeps clupeoides]|uniref:T-lymphocyte surface antigen Ly-9-like n=1 Tax=Denticeps clupeoides TaxID=299321 RepID=UPI0010A4C575|nr:T-lymphocyte surface antigen Ly-9-like [Denticeps clupeoides]